jgi:hypothetical protein
VDIFTTVCFPITFTAFDFDTDFLFIGGVDLQVRDTTGVQCNSYAKYGETPEYVQPKMNMPGMAGHADAGTADKHISSMHACYFDEIKNRKISKGSGSWHITATYDYDKFPGMKEDGKQSSIMGM